MILKNILCKHFHQFIHQHVFHYNLFNNQLFIVDHVSNVVMLYIDMFCMIVLLYIMH